ncbi:MAG: polyribonucleotide nucleotidyltransferase [Rickettsiaceae bacterium]|jgi:polyribonucleotide nucleotidyltransferase|nr:polyribonucleotide nucleotidyltransferase [Rickettsiaceae bacterium]
MFNEIKREINWGGKIITLETGKIARQASSVMARMGNTVVLCAVTVSSKAMEGADFFPLTVNYIEKYYAAGKIPGGFFKREAKPSDNATLVSRLIDRPIRPMFPSNFHNEVNVVCTVLSYDPNNNPDIVALVGASAALAISEAPFLEAIAGARVGYVDGGYVLNPSITELKNSKLDLIVAGTKSSVLMVESEAKELSEEIMLGAVQFGHDQMQVIIDAINDFKNFAGKQKIVVAEKNDADLKKAIADSFGSRIVGAFKKQIKQERSKDLEAIKSEIMEFVKTSPFAVDGVIDENKVSAAFKDLEKDVVRGDIIKSGARIDGRAPDQIRQISAEVGILPQVHGSALFTRGETQALVITTVGSSRDEQTIDGLEATQTKETFMLHYNFPPYSVGEVGRLGTPGRREIGHGKLAWRAINPILPSQEQFGYVTRVVSEITESNGSSSMATVCGTSLSLMDAGVPLPKPVSGIAMGLIKEGENYVILSDIMGDEDHLGDMDFKVAGTKDGITALQMDIKINGINFDIMKSALHQAHNGRLHILEKMADALSEARTSLNGNVPKVEIMNIPVKKIKDVIGSRGKVIKGICEETGVLIDINDDGVVKVSGNNPEGIKKAMTMINEITFEPEVGNIYEGPVVKVIDAGAFINIANGKDGFVHISELAEYRVDFVEDVINEGDIVKVKIIGFDKKGRPKLSYRSVDQVTGEDISHKFPQPVRDDFDRDDRREERRGRDRDRGDRDNHNRDRDRDHRDSRRDRRDDYNKPEEPKKRRGFFS